MSKKDDQFDEGFELVDPLDPHVPNPVPDWAEVSPDELDADPTAPQDRQKATRYQEDFHYRVIEEDGWFPLATFRVPRGFIGNIFQIQTFAVTFQGTNTIYWYSQFDPLLLQKFGVVPIQWMLQAQTRRSIEYPPPPVVPFASPPTPPHPQLAAWSDGRFMWNALNNRLRLPVNEGTVVRLWCGVPTDLPGIERPDVIGGRLVGLTQSYKDNPAAKNASDKGW